MAESLAVSPAGDGMCGLEFVVASVGDSTVKQIHESLEWACLLVSLGLLLFYCYEFRKKSSTVGWEIVYVSVVEALSYSFLIFYPHANPVQWNIVTGAGRTVVWLRYAEWLMCTPVIIMALANISGEEGEYSHKSMHLLATNQGCILCGVVAAASTGPCSIIFYLASWGYSLFTYYFALQIYIEAYFTLPKECRKPLIVMSILFYTGWLVIYPVLFTAGREGFGNMSYEVSALFHAIGDLLAKNSWGFLHWYVRCQLRAYKAAHDGKLPHFSLEERHKIRAEAAHLVKASLGSVLHGHHGTHHDHHGHHEAHHDHLENHHGHGHQETHHEHNGNYEMHNGHHEAPHVHNGHHKTTRAHAKAQAFEYED